MIQVMPTTLTALLLALFITAEPPPRCSISVNPFLVPPEATYLWAVFTTTMVPVTGGAHHALRFSPGHWSAPDSTIPLQGQIVSIGGAFGHSAGAWRESAPRAVLVLWDYDAGCEPVPFGNASEPWGVPGDTVLMAAWLRPRHQWSSSMPTFDVYLAGEGIYPPSRTYHGREFADYLRANPIEDLEIPAKYLSPVQAFELVRDLPSRCDYVTRPRRSAIRLWWASRKWSRMLDHYPVEDVLNTHRSFQQSDTRASRWCTEARPNDGP